MSEILNNREYRKEVLKSIIKDLHDGKPLAAVKARFDEAIKDLVPGELSLVEQSLINEGLPIEEVQRLCDVHSAVFRDALENTADMTATPGHPVHTFMEENRALEKLVHDEIKPLLTNLRQASGAGEQELSLKLAELLNLLWDVDKHYSRKENLLFPYLEKYGITAPPKVMWGVDDEIRAQLKKARTLAGKFDPAAKGDLISETEDVLERITEMIFKEEKILFPMAVETLAEDEWYQILEDSSEIGYCLVEPQKGWQPVREKVTTGKELADDHSKGYIKFDTGVMTPQEIELVFSHMPVDVTFVDKDDKVKFFSNSKERIFARTRTIIGRKVENCHPPASVHVVEEIVNDFKSGKKNHEDFYIHFAGKYVYIRYFAVRDEQGKYMGTLEVTQDIQPIQAIIGEKRIAD